MAFLPGSVPNMNPRIDLTPNIDISFLDIGAHSLDSLKLVQVMVWFDILLLQICLSDGHITKDSHLQDTSCLYLIDALDHFLPNGRFCDVRCRYLSQIRELS